MSDYDLGDDWCDSCEMARPIVDVSDETAVQTIHGTGPEFIVYHLACGHALAVPMRRWSA